MESSRSMSPGTPQDSNNVRNDSEDFRSVPQDSEPFRTVPNDAEARESHTLTVREVARMFEEAGVARTERSVINWCQKDAAGVSRLDSYLDPNERKHFITPESAERAIREELAKAGAADSRQKQGQPAARIEKAPEESGAVEELEQKVLDLTIMNQGKDYIIEQLKEDRSRLFEEQQGLVERLADSSREVGRLEAKLHLLEEPNSELPTEDEA